MTNFATNRQRVKVNVYLMTCCEEKAIIKNGQFSLKVFYIPLNDVSLIKVSSE